MSDLHLLPANATQGERDVSLAIERHADLPVPVRDVWNADTCPVPLLPWLAWAYSVDVWDAAWTEAQKRAAIKSSIDVHRYKGTIGAVKEALAALSVEAKVQDWFAQDPPGDPYTFKIILEGATAGITQEATRALFQVVERTKNLRSHLDGVRITVTSQAGPQVAVVATLGSDITLAGYEFPTVVLNSTAFCI
jgi:phage tail P2-like protein